MSEPDILYHTLGEYVPKRAYDELKAELDKRTEECHQWMLSAQRRIRDCESLAAERDQLRAELDGFKSGMLNFRCPVCKQVAGPLYPVNLLHEYDQLRAELDEVKQHEAEVIGDMWSLQQHAEKLTEALKRLSDSAHKITWAQAQEIAFDALKEWNEWKREKNEL